MTKVTQLVRMLAVASLVFGFGACAASSDGAEVATTNTIVETNDVAPTPPPLATTQALPSTELPTTQATTESTNAAPTADVTPAPTAVPERSAEPPAPPAVLSTGSEGAAVEDIQDLLNDLIGYANLASERISEDGIYGPDTEAAQRSFESFASIEVDGAATLDDRIRLEEAVSDFEMTAAESVVSQGDTSSVFVGSWQRRLNIWNDLVLERPVSITVDDRFGPDTEAATFAVEEALGLQVDGIVEPGDRAALRSAIARLRAEDDATVLLRTTDGNHTIIVRAFYADDAYCLRFVVDFAADERCTATPGGDINAAYFVTVNGVSFVAGTANPDVAFATLSSRIDGTTPVATRQFGNSLARAWVEIVAEEPDTVELRKADGTSVLELRFSLEPTDRDFFGSTISLLSPQYEQTFFVDSCSRPGGTDLVLEASLATSKMVINVAGETGSLVIDSGNEAAPVQITGTISAADITVDAVLVTGEFTGDVFDGASFTATANC